MAPRTSISWFPGHMRAAMTALKRVLKSVDLVLEVRDARLPLSSSNPELTGLLSQKRHIVVLNKADLVPSKQHKAAVHHLQQQGLKVVAASCASGTGVPQVMNTALDWLTRERAASELSIIMCCGLPNSGKSSLINAFKLAARRQGVLAGEQAHQKKARVGMTPGLTRQVAGFQVCAEPAVYMLDTPGIMIPAVPSDEVGMRLALAGAIKDAVVGEEQIVKFLLQFLGRDISQALRAVRASGPVGGNSSSSSTRHAGSGSRGRQGGKGGSVNQEVHRMRACLYKVLSSSLHVGSVSSGGEPWDSGAVPVAQPRGGGLFAPDVCVDDSGLLLAGSEQFVLQSQPPPGWMLQSGAEEQQEVDWDLEAAEARYDALLHCMGVAGARNPSKEQGALIRLLRAFREGHLGRFMLDNTL